MELQQNFQQQDSQYLQEYNFPLELQNRLQMLALTDQQEIREISRHSRAMERDVLRSNLKEQQQYSKQVMRQIHEEIVQKGCSYYYCCYNGSGNGLYAKEIFLAKIHGIKCYRYHGSKEITWQIVLIEGRTGKEVISPLYTENDLKVISKLKQTILSTYECSDSVKSRSFFWEWMRKQMMSMLRETEVVEIPSRPGWYADEGNYHFYTMADQDTSRFSAYMERFNMFRSDRLDQHDTLCLLMDTLERAGDLGSVGMLLIYRFSTLLGRLVGQPCFRTGMIVWGEQAEEVIRCFLCTMICDMDTINLDSDRLEKIRKKVRVLQDTPAIFLVTTPENKSVQNRLREVTSWMQTSCIEGEQVNAPFVFCLKHFSVALLMENMLVLDADRIQMKQEGEAIERFQCLVIEKIEQSGQQWVDEIAARYDKYNKNRMGETVSMARMIKEVLLRIFDDVCVSQESFLRLQDLLEAGEGEIEHQLSKRMGRMSEIFRNQIIELVEAGSIKIFKRENALVSDESNHIYFDGDCYYFTSEVLEIIAELANMDRRSILNVKQELYGLSMLKTYRAMGQRPEELHVDFRICNAYGQRIDLSGMAVLREFWDEIGGVALWERA